MSAKSARERLKAWGLASIAAAGLCLGLWSPASACELLVETPEAVRIEYNPFAIGASSGPLDLVFHNRSDTACELRLLLIDDAGDPVPVIALGGVLAEFRPRESSGVFRRDVEPGAFLFRVPENGSARGELDVAILQNAVVEAGEHAADLRVSILDLAGEAHAPPVPLRVILTSAPRAQVNIAGAAGAFGSGSSVEVVDFGEAATGVTRRVFVQVRANTQSTLTVKSEHHGVMRHLEMGEAGTVVPYSLELDGVLVDLTETWTHDVDPPRTLDGQSLPMDFTLGQIGGQMSGRYEDLVTIDITPR